MKIMYMGTPAFAATVLEEMAKEFSDSTFSVVTKPDTPKGRSYKLVESEVAKTAGELGFTVYKPQNLKEENFREILESEAPDVIVVAAFGKILPRYVLDFPKYKCLNVHGSLLPEYRGAAPVNRAIMDGRMKTGITIMLMEEGLDTGDMILKEEVDITEEDTATTLFEKLAHVGSRLIVKTLRDCESGNVVFEKQNDALSTYAEKITDADMKIDWNKSAFEIVRKIHGLADEPGAMTRIASSGKILKIYKASVGDKVEGKCGEVVLAKKKIQIACRDGSVFLEKVKCEGGKLLSGADFANGRGVTLGDILE